MIHGDERASNADRSIPQGTDAGLPLGTVPLVEFRAAAIERSLGYFRSERFVLFNYCPGGGEVIWKDGHSSGFGTGGWRVFLYEIVPVAARHGASIGDLNSIGTHVILMDRKHGGVYAAPREDAEEFLANINGIPQPHRRCLCATLDCASCPVRTCPLAGIRERGKSLPDAIRTAHA